MLTKVTIRNFKRFDEVSIELGNPVVFIGPNNSGKTTALQALALWDIGLRRWNEKRGGQTPEKRPGVTINRRDLIAIPVPNANLLWRGLHVRDTRRSSEGKSETQNVRIDIVVEGVTEGSLWTCGLEFDYANEESFYCRPLRKTETRNPERWSIPSQAAVDRIAFLPPMSGLAANETRLDPGAINVRLGEGRTAEVLRNLCYQIANSSPEENWSRLRFRMQELFKVRLGEPEYIPERGEVTMTYVDPSGIELDISASGRGLQQTLLLLAHLTLNPKSVLLIDEPDAHLEILRQRQIYQVLSDTAREHGSQIIIASHSEIILNEAADRDVVVAFVGRPHRIDDRGSQLLKSLKEIGFDQYYQAEQTGWVLYLEGSTDLAILRAFAEVLDHPAQQALERPFVHYVQNQYKKAQDHFFGLREARQDLHGFALFDRLQQPMEPRQVPEQWMWRRREIENYLCYRETLLGWAKAEAERNLGPLFGGQWLNEMEEAISQVQSAMETLGKGSPWSPDTKVSDDFLDPLFENFYKRLELPNLMRKTDYHTLARYVPRELIDPEVGQVLDRIHEVCLRAHGNSDSSIS
ncbi:MAG TPA: AAA family ATPase [Thermoanaerobaculia bacterium]|nr:AAA family ATPase [Thermoanaerobaculia bacterium]